MIPHYEFIMTLISTHRYSILHDNLPVAIPKFSSIMHKHYPYYDSYLSIYAVSKLGPKT